MAPSRSESSGPVRGIHRVLLLASSFALASCTVARHHSPRLVPGASATTATPLESSFRLVVWNIHKRTDSVFLSELGVLMDSTRADLAMLQEVAIPSDPHGFDLALRGRSWALSANLRRTDPPEEIGVATASRSPAIESKAMLSTSGEPLADTRKAALATRYAIGDRTLTVVNIHALNFSPGLDGFRQQLAEIASLLREAGGPRVVAGDFNTWREDKLALADSVMGSIGLERLDFGRQENDKKRFFGNALDHVYYTPAHLLADSASSRVHTWCAASDHFPLEAAFFLKPDSSSTR